MAFDPALLSAQLDSIGGGSCRIFGYGPTTDTRAAIIAEAGYITAASTRGLHVDDAIMVHGADGLQMYLVFVDEITVGDRAVLKLEQFQSDVTGTVPAPYVQIMEDEPSLRYFGAKIDGLRDDLSAWNLMYAAANAGEIISCKVPHGTTVISAHPNAITADNFALTGNGTTILIPSDAGSGVGTFFTLGTASDPCANTRISGFRLQCANDPTDDVFAIDCPRPNDCDIRHMFFESVGSLVRIGGSTAGSRAARAWFENWKGNLNNGADCDSAILLRNCTNTTFRNFNFNCVRDCSGNPDGAIVRFDPVADDGSTQAVIDTVRFHHVGMQMFSDVFDDAALPDDPPVLTPDGKPYGLFFHPRLNNIMNVWITDSYFDHTTTAAIRYFSEAGDLGIMRAHFINNCRFSQDDGISLDIDHDFGALVRAIQITQNRFQLRNDDPFVDIDGSGFKNCSFSYNQLADSYTAGQVPAAIRLGADGWMIKDNMGESDVSTANVLVGIEITNADLTVCDIEGNWFPAADIQLVEPAYTTNPAPERIIMTPHQLVNSPSAKVTFMDDFLGDVLAAPWTANVGSDGQIVTPTILANQANGVVRLVTGDDAAADMATNGLSLTQHRAWLGSGQLTFETRIAISAITDVCVFIGLSDDPGTLEMPFTLGALDALTSNASNAVGVLFDTGAATDNWWLVGVKGDTDATHQNAGVAPTAATFERWRVEITTQGHANFFRNGVRIGTTMTNALNFNVQISPVIAAFSRGAAIRNIDLDYVFLQQSRA